MRIFSRNYLAISVALFGLACGQAEDPLVEIRKLHEEGRYAATVDQLRTLVDQDPSRAETQFLLGSALLFSGNGGLAVWPLRAAAQAPEYAIEARMLLARSMLESRTAPDAIPIIGEILELEPENIPAMVLRIQAYQATGRNEDALVDIERVLELEPDNGAVLVPRVTALIATEQIDEAEKAIEDARERLDNADEEVDQSFVAMLCVARGLFAHEKGDDRGRRSPVRGVPRAVPRESVRRTRGREFLWDDPASGARNRDPREGFGAKREQRLPHGARRADEEVGRKPKNRSDCCVRRPRSDPPLTSWFRLADFYVGRDEFDKALEAFDHALALSPDPPESLLFAYADTLVQAEQFDKARSIVEGFEESALRDLIIGRILLAQGDPAGALVSFEAGILLWPNNPAGRFLAGQAAERIGDFDRALSEYRESIRANPARTRAGWIWPNSTLCEAITPTRLDAVKRHMQSNPGDIDGMIVGIRVAHKARRYGIASEGLKRLSEDARARGDCGGRTRDAARRERPGWSRIRP